MSYCFSYNNLGRFRPALKIGVITLIMVLGLFANTDLKAQDQHFSQFFTNPLLYNPANTGYFNGNYRVGVNYRAQWPFAINGKLVTYQNYSAFTDFSFLEKVVNKVDFAGIGAYALSDQAGDGNLKTTKFNLSLAYHKGFDKHNKYMLSGGFGAAYVLRSIDFTKLYFNDQWNGKTFNPDIPALENYSSNSAHYFDINAGLMMRLGFSERYAVNVGGALYHINRPRDTFYNGDNRIGMKTVIQSNFHAKVTDVFDLDVYALFATQKKAIEASFSALATYAPYSYRKEANYKFYVGAIYRVRDAFAPTIGTQLGPVRLLLNYDITTSHLARFNNGIGAFEVSLTYTGKFPNHSGMKKVYCPKF
jgi:type IX secretion system PorP/SprF family membrane protein